MTTHVDRQNDRFARSALESAANQLKRNYIPIGLEHDPRLPPFGRVVAAQVVDLADGEVGLYGLMELFEPHDVIPLARDGRTIPISEEPVGFVELLVDRDLCALFREEVAEVERLLDRPVSSEIKKGAGGPEVVTLAATFVLGAISGGFLQALGADVYEGMKRIVSRLFQSRNEREQVFRLLVTVEAGSRRVALEVMATNPNPIDVLRILELATNQLDSEVAQILHANPEVSRIVFEMVGERLQMKFAVRRDAVPIFPSISQRS